VWWLLSSFLLSFAPMASLFARPQQAARSTLLVTPSTVVLVVGETFNLDVIDSSGRPAKNARWSIDYPIAEVTVADGGVQLTARRPGRAFLTAELDNLSASATISVVGETQLPPTTVHWSLLPTPGYNTLMARYGAPQSESDPQFFSIEWSPSAGTMIRGLQLTGEQLWSTHLSVSASPRTLKPWTRPAVGATSLAGKPIENVRQLLLLEGGAAAASSSEQARDQQLPLKGQTILVRDSGDGFGGLLLLEFGHSADSLVDLRGSDGSERWRYQSAGYLNQNYTVNFQGDIGIVETVSNPPGSALLVLNGKTGDLRYRIPFPASSTTIHNFKCSLGNDMVNIRASRAGSVFTNTDGNMYVQVEVHKETTNALPCKVGEYIFDNYLDLLRVTPNGEAEWTRFAEVHSDANGPFQAQPRLFAGESIPDGLEGVLAAWNYFFPGTKNGEEPHLEARLTRLGPAGQADYTLPMPGWSLDPTALWDENMVLGDEHTLYAINRHVLISFHVPTGELKWARQPPTGEIALDWATAGGGVLVSSQGRLGHFDHDGNGKALPWTIEASNPDDIGLVQFDLFDHTSSAPLQVRIIQPNLAGGFLAVEDSPPAGQGTLFQFGVH